MGAVPRLRARVATVSAALSWLLRDSQVLILWSLPMECHLNLVLEAG